MYALYRAIPDADVVVSLAPEELAGKLLFLLQSERGNFSPYNFENDLRSGRDSETYPHARREEVGQALREAFAWLSAQGLIVPAPYQSDSTWKVLSRRARSFTSPPEFDAFLASKRLQKERLHARISETVWQAFIRGEYDVAVFQAMKAVEVAVREASGLNNLLGVALMRAAFHPENGPLTDRTTEGGERDARAALFAGAIGSYKNPHSHRDVQLSDPDEAFETIMLANHLLRIVDARSAARREN
ncbi:TIGR02391 family protein [Rhizobium halophilum]|uniref:TIGR02391 family protein n=1 Tax=Rhizobium halophilum TaxID=2846852 RepID=UPI001EFE850F|nr:TIGR02391 family protein [Rhizobium halophilum]MCF6371064.1 TIGR02391 family protein [Rhizobium halophilum]